MNKKGFTLVELITTFALTAVIVTILVNVSVIIRNMYNKANIKTHLLIEQANLSNALNTKLNKKNLVDYSSCTGYSFCYDFAFSDGSTERLAIDDTYIKFGNYIYKLKDGSEVGSVSLGKEAISEESSDSEFLVLRIPIVNKLYPNEDFGINLVYQYNLSYIMQPEPIILAATEKSKTVAGNIPKGNFAFGDEYTINVDGSNRYHFYVLSVEGDKVNLIMSNNICSDGSLATTSNKCLTSWYSSTESNLYGPATAFNYLHEATKNWSNIENIKMGYMDEGNSGSYGYVSISTTGTTTKITTKAGQTTGTYENLKARLPKFSEMTGAGCTEFGGSCPVWMVNGLNASTNSYPSGVKEDISGLNGYWGLSSYTYGVQYTRCISHIGLYDEHASVKENYGIRPVIEISKSKF